MRKHEAIDSGECITYWNWSIIIRDSDFLTTHIILYVWQYTRFMSNILSRVKQ